MHTVSVLKSSTVAYLDFVLISLSFPTVAFATVPAYAFDCIISLFVYFYGLLCIFSAYLYDLFHSLRPITTSFCMRFSFKNKKADCLTVCRSVLVFRMKFPEKRNFCSDFVHIFKNENPSSLP